MVNRPVKFMPIVIPAMVSGQEKIDGNVATDKNFLITALNLLQGFTKVFGNDEEIPFYFDTSIWPGLELFSPQNDFKPLNYVGEEDKPFDWGDLAVADFDFDGIAEGRVEDGVPLFLYKTLDSNANVDYEAMWEEVKGNLSSEDSFWQTLEENQSYPTTEEGCFAFLVGVNDARRRYVLAMSAIGVDVFNPNGLNGQDAIDKFQNVFDTRYQEAGALNTLYLSNYFRLRTEIAKRFTDIADNDWVKNTMLQCARNYYVDCTAGVDLNPLQNKISNFNSLISILNNLIGSDGKIADPNDVQSVRDKLESIRNMLAALSSDIAGARSGFGMIRNDLIQLIAEFESNKGSYLEAEPSNIDADTVFTSLTGMLDGINLGLASIFSGFDAVQQNPGMLVDGIFGELAAPISQEPLSETLASCIASRFSTMLKKPFNYTLKIHAANSSLRSLNKTNKNKYDERKEEENEEKAETNKAEARHMAKQKAAAKRDEKIKESAGIKKLGKKPIDKVKRRKS